MVSQRTEPSRWRQNEMDTAASRTFLFLAHTANANQNKPHLKIWPRKRQVPTGSTSYVGTCSPTSVQCKIQPLELWESVLTCFTTPLRSIKYLHVPLELRDFALFGGLETWSIPIRLEWRKSFSCWTAAFWTAAFKVWGKMKRCKAEGVSKFENEGKHETGGVAQGIWQDPHSGTGMCGVYPLTNGFWRWLFLLEMVSFCRSSGVHWSSCWSSNFKSIPGNTLHRDNLTSVRNSGCSG